MVTIKSERSIVALVTLLLCSVPPSWANPSISNPLVRHSERDAGPTVTLGNTSVVGQLYKFAGTVELEFFGGESSSFLLPISAWIAHVLSRIPMIRHSFRRATSAFRAAHL